MSRSASPTHSYKLERHPQVSLGPESTAVEDTSKIKAFLRKIGKYNPKTDSIYVHTGTGDITLNLTNKLTFDEMYNATPNDDVKLSSHWYHIQTYQDSAERSE